MWKLNSLIYQICKKLFLASLPELTRLPESYKEWKELLDQFESMALGLLLTLEH